MSASAAVDLLDHIAKRSTPVLHRRAPTMAFASIFRKATKETLTNACALTVSIYFEKCDKWALNTDKN